MKFLIYIIFVSFKTEFFSLNKSLIFLIASVQKLHSHMESSNTNNFSIHYYMFKSHSQGKGSGRL